MSDKKLTPTKYKLKLNTEKTYNPIRNWAKDIKRYYTEKKIQMANKTD